MGNKVQNKGVGGGSFLSVLFSVISKSWFCCLQPEPPLLFSPETQPHPSFHSLSTVCHLQRGKVQLETFLKQTTLLWSKRLFLKIASPMMLSDISAFSSLKEFKLTSFESLLKEKIKKSQANLEWRSRAWRRSRSGSKLCSPWTLALGRFLVTLQSVLSVPASVLRCIFFSVVRQTRALYAWSSLFCAPLWRTFYAEIDGQGFGFAVMCLPVAMDREGAPMSTGTGEQAFGIYRVTVCIFYPQAEGDSDNGQWIALTCECLMLQQTHQEGDKWLFRMEAFSADNVCTVNFSRVHLFSRKLNVIEWQLSLNKILFCS